MKLWNLIRLDVGKWDEYEGFVVRASTREQAKEYLPGGRLDEEPRYRYGKWRVIELKPGTKPGIVLSNFRAG